MFSTHQLLANTIVGCEQCTLYSLRSESKTKLQSSESTDLSFKNLFTFVIKYLRFTRGQFGLLNFSLTVNSLQPNNKLLQQSVICNHDKQTENVKFRFSDSNINVIWYKKSMPFQVFGIFPKVIRILQ